MASNQYRQQWPQGPAPVQQQQSYRYDRRDDQSSWQENGRGQGPYNQEYQRYNGHQHYNGHPKSRNGYGQGALHSTSNHHEQDWQWQGQDQYSQESYGNPYAAEIANGYQQAPPQEPYYDDGHRSNRSYQYDERFRNNGPFKPPLEPEHPGSSQGQRAPRHQTSEPPTPRARPKQRERILPQPTSPKNMAWDNPFGAFPGKKRPGDKERRASLDNRMNDLTIDDTRHSGGDDDARPHTSHGHRVPARKEVPRPSISRDRPPETGQPPLQDNQTLPGRGSLDINRPHQGMSATFRPPLQDYQIPQEQVPSDMSRSRQDPSYDMRRPPLQDHQGPRGRDQSDVNRPRQNLASHPIRPPVQDYQAPSGRDPSVRNRLHQNISPDLGRMPFQDYQTTPNPVPPDADGQRQDLNAGMGRRPLQEYQSPMGRGSSDVNRQRQNFRSQGENSPPAHRAEQGTPRGAPPPPMSQDRPRPAPYGSMPNPPPQSDFRSGGRQRLQRPRPDAFSREENSYVHDYSAPSNPYESPSGPPPSIPPPQSRSQGNYDNGPYRAGPVGPVAPNRMRSPEVPNFDAIPPRANEKPEDHINPSAPSSFDPQIYRKPTYQVPGGFPGPIDTTQSKPAQPSHAASPLAEFSFDLPPQVDTRQTVPRRNGQPAQAPFQREYSDMADFGSRPLPVGGYEGEWAQQATTTQYPPRGASRNGIKPPTGDLPLLPATTGEHGSFGQDRPPARPHTSNTQRQAPQSYDVGNPYDQETPEYRTPSAPAVPGLYNQAYSQAGVSQPYRAAYGQAPPLRKGSHDNHSVGGLRPSTSNSAHPVPVRVYPDANGRSTPSGNARGSGSLSSNLSANVNPDALPAHPEPVRPGLKNNGYIAPQPAPVQPGPMQVTAPMTAGAGSANTPQVTVQELNDLRQKYTQNPGDHALGLKLAKRLVEGARFLSDEGGKADAKQTQKNRERYVLDAHKLVKKLVAANYPEAMFYLADCHGQGLLGLPVDAKEAFHLYQSAAKMNHAQSAYRVAVCCELGSEEGGGTRRDPMKAMQWYKRAATLGDTPAMYKLGMILLKGLLGQAKNPREGVSWLKRAAERADKDNPHALHELGLIYESVTPLDHIVRDEAYAFQLFQQAAELGYKYSQFRLGSAFEYGLLGCPIDSRQSIAWYTRAAAQGEHQSELALSGWYLTGSEPLLTQSDTEAFLWARKAASSGLAKAEYAMGYFHEVGIGTAVDVEEARRWYFRAAAQNFAKARERLEELRRGQKMSKTRVSRSNVNRQSDGECVVM